MKPEDIEPIRRIKQTHEKLWLGIEGVVAVGIGTTSSGEAGLIVSVKGEAEKIRRQIPNSVGNITVEIRESGELKAL